MEKKTLNLKEFLSSRGKGIFILIKATVNQEDIAVLNMYVPNSGTPTSLKNVLLD